MRKSKEETAESRRRILREAARLYRERGFDGVGVAEIMEAAGMTHGGFYRHFPSKEALIAEAMAEAFADRLPLLTAGGGAAGDAAAGPDMVRSYVGLYLSAAHLDNPALGCPVAAVGSEAAHLGGPVSQAFREGIELLAEKATAALGAAPGAQRPAVLRLFATLVGAVVIARAAGPGSVIAGEVLEAVRTGGEVARLMEAG
ncbi:TetR/AcrR family transcriptional regulator [Roseomonas sp. GC11]|uniref:TetR/AcrR family transcriptional regulator n=1 Tax=Roseomonas sp. GC11 TaxID=2950546 RepID=UPI0021098DF2|nr:TetR/AcrR family transcriptional regulator [Roseomonas sp. GC11]MCQ4161376.1 TetR/AcrR family transcriptional regulator [Roseomonas sp. GC11]